MLLCLLCDFLYPLYYLLILCVIFCILALAFFPSSVSIDILCSCIGASKVRDRHVLNELLFILLYLHSLKQLVKLLQNNCCAIDFGRLQWEQHPHETSSVWWCSGTPYSGTPSTAHGPWPCPTGWGWWIWKTIPLSPGLIRGRLWRVWNHAESRLQWEFIPWWPEGAVQQTWYGEQEDRIPFHWPACGGRRLATVKLNLKKIKVTFLSQHMKRPTMLCFLMKAFWAWT